jgi:hypothetical protein
MEGNIMATEEKVRLAISAARKLQMLHNGDSLFLVVANADGIDYIDAEEEISDLAEWDIAGAIVLAGESLAWMEVFPDHNCPPLTEEKIAEEMEWDDDHDPTHYTPEYRAATTVALIADRKFDVAGPIYMGDRLILDSSIPGENSGLLLKVSGSLADYKRTIEIDTDKGKLLLHEDGPVLRFGDGFPCPGEPCTAESMAASIPLQDLRAIGALADKLPWRKLAREAMAIKARSLTTVSVR